MIVEVDVPITPFVFDNVKSLLCESSIEKRVEINTRSETILICDVVSSDGDLQFTITVMNSMLKINGPSGNYTFGYFSDPISVLNRMLCNTVSPETMSGHLVSDDVVSPSNSIDRNDVYDVIENIVFQKLMLIDNVNSDMLDDFITIITDDLFEFLGFHDDDSVYQSVTEDYLVNSLRDAEDVWKLVDDYGNEVSVILDFSDVDKILPKTYSTKFVRSILAIRWFVSQMDHSWLAIQDLK